MLYIIFYYVHIILLGNSIKLYFQAEEDIEHFYIKDEHKKHMRNRRGRKKRTMKLSMKHASYTIFVTEIFHYLANFQHIQLNTI